MANLTHFDQLDTSPYTNRVDFEHELDSDITIRGTENIENIKYSTEYSRDHLMTSPLVSQTRRHRPVRLADSSPRAHFSTSNIQNLIDLDDYYEDEDDEDYYPTSSDADETDDGFPTDGLEESHGLIQRIQPDVTTMEKVVILSTFIGTALGIVIGYVLFLSESE